MTLEDEFDPDKRQRKYMLQNPEHVLVRLKVEHSGFTTLNNQRFGSRFVGEVVSFHEFFLLYLRVIPCSSLHRYFCITSIRQIPLTFYYSTGANKLKAPTPKAVERNQMQHQQG